MSNANQVQNVTTTRPGADILGYMKLYAKYCAELMPDNRRHTVVQAGGHTGTVPKVLATYFEHVITFEPHPINFVHLTEVCQNTGIKAMEAALSDKDGFLWLDTPPGRTDLAHVVAANLTQPPGRVTVRTVPLDKYSFQVVDLLMLDCAGHEYEALEGATDTIYKHRPIIAVEQGFVKGHTCRRAEAALWMRDHGYVATNFCNSDVIFRHTSELPAKEEKPQ